MFRLLAELVRVGYRLVQSLDNWLDTGDTLEAGLRERTGLPARIELRERENIPTQTGLQPVTTTDGEDPPPNGRKGRKAQVRM